MPENPTDPCPGCGRRPGPYLVLVGWEPCRCGGHRTVWCRDDNGGCGVTRYVPGRIDGRCHGPIIRTAPPDERPLDHEE